MIVLKGFLIKEFKQVFRDPRMKFILFLAPVIQLTFFGLVLTSEVKNIKLVTLHHSDHPLLQKIEQKALATGLFKGTALSAQEREIAFSNPEQLLAKGAADIVLLENRQSPQQIQMLINAMNIIRAQSIENYIKSLLVDKNIPSIRFDVRMLYNPTMESALFMVPGVMCMLSCILTIILTSMSMAKEREGGTMEMIIATSAKPWEILLGKTIPFVILGMIIFTVIFLVGIFLLQVPMRGSILFAYASAFVFVCTTVGIGTLISSIAKGQQQAMMGSFLFLFPAILLSGVMFPLDNMPSYLKFLAWIDPINYFVVIMRTLMLKGGSITTLFAPFFTLLSMCLLVSFLTLKRFRSQLQ